MNYQMPKRVEDPRMQKLAYGNKMMQ